MVSRIALISLALGFLIFSVTGAPLGAENGGAAMSVTREEGVWSIQRGADVVTLREDNLGVRFQVGGAAWEMLPSGADDLRISRGGKEESTSLLKARRVRFSPWKTGHSSGVQVSLAEFPAGDGAADLSLVLRVSVEGTTGDVLFEAVPTEGADRVTSLSWPGGMRRPEASAGCFTVIPAMQGVLLPADWPKEVRLFGSLTQTRALYMPWWGELRGKSGYVAILETPFDGGLGFSHPAGGPTSTAPHWVASLGRLGYPRVARYSFCSPATYVTLAKRYRRYVRENGRFVSLAEKMARSPGVRRLLGNPVIHEGIWAHIEPASSYYRKGDPAANDVLYNTFDQLAEKVRKLGSLGVKRAYMHVDGWGQRGYDNLHPDPLPPAERAGGCNGFRRLADACAESGVLFALHDQYRDFYLDAPSFSEDQAVTRPDGTHPSDSTWYGGKQMFLCASQAQGYVRRNYDSILKHGVRVKGAYLDVFAIADLDECFSPLHPMSRRDCADYRAACFGIIRSLGLVVSSEEPVDYAVPYLDLVHHGPYATHPGLGGGGPTGIPVPLFSLVYHDSTFLPWEMGEDGGWGIPKGDAGWLHALLNAGLPYLSVSPTPEAVKRAREVCNLNRRVGTQEMTHHEFLDESYRRQRSTFANGVQVEVDFDARTYRVVEPRRG